MPPVPAKARTGGYRIGQAGSPRASPKGRGHSNNGLARGALRTQQLRAQR
jgi:hypothetical protein